MIDVIQDEYNGEEAGQVLDALYQTYFQRTPDPSGQASYLPVLMEYGFRGLIFVAYQILHSPEMSNRVREDLNRIYLEYLGRNLDSVGRQVYDVPIRFFRQRGRARVIESIKKSPEYRGRQEHLSQFEREIQRLKRAIEAEPENPKIYVELAEISERVQRYYEAIGAYSKAIELQEAPEAGLYFKRGLVHQRLADWEDAVHDFTVAIENDLENQAQVYFRRGLAYEQMGSLDEAITDYGYVASLGVENAAEAWHRTGLIQQQREQLHDAIKSFSKAVELNPPQTLLADVYLARARTCIRANQYEQAAADFSRFVARSKDRKRLIQGAGPTVYLVKGGEKRAIPDPATLNYVALGHELQLLERVSTVELNAYPEGEPITSIWEYSLIRGPDHAIYWIEDGKRRWIPNPDTFTNLGLDPTRVEDKPKEELSRYPVGQPVPSVLGKLRLVRSTADGNYYLIEKGRRRLVPNLATLAVLGYDSDEVEELALVEIDKYPAGVQIPDLAGRAGPERRKSQRTLQRTTRSKPSRPYGNER